jgi:hypothetical protein
MPRRHAKLVPATLPLRPGDVFTADGWKRPVR